MNNMEYKKIPLEQIIKSDNQPRKKFDEEKLQELASSMTEVGQLQPIIVQEINNQYLLIAGERRYRAMQKTKDTKEIAAVIIKEKIDEQMFRQIQLVENLQRQELNPLERATSIQQFMDDNDLTKKDASQRIGVPRTTLTEWLNILDVAPKYQQAVLDDDSPVTLSHITLAKSLASRTGDPTKIKNLLDGIIQYNLSKSETKEIINIFYKYLHIPMEEALATILLKRERMRVKDYLKDNKKGNNKNPEKSLVRSFSRMSDKLEKVMAEISNLNAEAEASIIDEFLYIYQVLEVMIPKLREESIEEMILDIKNRNQN